MFDQPAKLHWGNCFQKHILLDPGVSGVQSMGSLLSHWQTERPFADLTDVTLADEDTNPILTDNANRTFQGNLATRVTQPGGQIWNQAMQVTWSDDQILNRFATNQKMHIHKKYKTDFKKYCKSDVEKCKSVSIEIKWNVAKQVTQAGGKMCN